LFEEYYQKLSGGKETVEIGYESQLHENDLSFLLDEFADKDRRLKYTSQGIHKDDLLFNIDGYPVKKYGSQGQQKSFVIAIKLAQFEFTRRIKQFKPILLFDDIFDKLDDERVKQIIELVSENNFGQVFITDTQRSRIEQIFKIVTIDHNIFDIEDGIAQIE
jgi:DNA replication and repair protein RecF